MDDCQIFAAFPYISLLARGKLGLVLLGGLRQYAPGATGGLRQYAPGHQRPRNMLQLITIPGAFGGVHQGAPIPTFHGLLCILCAMVHCE